VAALSMDARMTICNMSIEGGARAGMVAPDQTTFEYLEGRPFVPRGREFHLLVDQWMSLPSDFGAKFDKTVELDATQIAPQVTWGTNPGMVTSVTDRVPDPDSFRDPDEQKAAVRALEYMDLGTGTPIVDILVDRDLIRPGTKPLPGDLRAAARVRPGERERCHLEPAR